MDHLHDFLDNVECGWDRLEDLRAQVMQDPRFQADAGPIPARDVWLLMELRGLAEFAADVKATEEQKEPTGDTT